MEIVSAGAFTVRVYWRPEAAREEEDYQEITPERSAVRAYILGADSPVEYFIDHVEGQPTPLKLAFRQVSTLESASTLLDESFQAWFLP